MKRLLPISLILLLLLSGGSEVLAQCPMCRATAETNLANGGTEGEGLNQGILYLLGMPYVLVATVAFIWWRNQRKETEIV